MRTGMYRNSPIAWARSGLACSFLFSLAHANRALPPVTPRVRAITGQPRRAGQGRPSCHLKVGRLSPKQICHRVCTWNVNQAKADFRLGGQTQWIDTIN